MWGEAAHFLYFNPRPPWGGRQKNSGLSRQAGFHFNPRPPWGGRPLRQLGKLCRLRISIHALRGEGDPRRHFDRHAAVDGISIHALRGEGDDNNIVLHGVITISIHALRGEGDNQKHALTMMFDEFQSTPSVGRATKFGGHRQGKHGISIHALRGEGDEKAYTLTAGYGDFNPRPPWGGRLSSAGTGKASTVFQSTPSVGRATKRRIRSQPVMVISIHALRGEGDEDRVRAKIKAKRFQSTPSVGRATLRLRRGSNSRTEISIHALRGEGDSYVVRRSTCYSYFNPRPPWGGRPQFLVYNIDNKYFNPRPPWGGRHAQFLVYNIDNKYFNPRPPWGGRRL